MHITLRGMLVILIGAPLLAAGTWLPVMRWVALIYLLFALILLIVDWQTAGKLEQFQVSREHDIKLSLGVFNAIKLRIHNLQRRSVSLQIRDEAPDAFEIDKRILETTIAPRGTWEAAYHIRPLRRGDYLFGKINLRWRAPLGLVVRHGALREETPVKVYPNLLDIRRYDLLLQKNRLQEIGLRNARLFGQGTEFERLRDYVSDDDFRRINWKATARRHSPVTVEYQTERSQNIVLAIDVGRMMQSPIRRIAKLDYIINAVLLFGYVATGLGDKIGLMTFADTASHYLSPRAGRGQFYRMLETLYAIEAQPVEPDYRRALSYLATRQRKRSLIVLFTDWTGGVSMNSLVSNLAVLAKRSLPLVVTISDPDVVQASQQVPQDTLSMYEREAAASLLDERELALETLHRHGVLTLDVPANQLSIAVINRYLELKATSRL